MTNWQLETPVAFLIFNRPEATARVFAEIARARPPKLLVVADGPRPDRPGEAEKCTAARAIIKQVDWPCEVLTNYAKTNLGCGRRVSSGLDWVFDTVDEAIILEDDCLPHPDFFRFCAELLNRYRENERVMMITGSNPLLRLDIPESYLFSRYFQVWGWASWRRAWQKYDFELTDWPQLKAQKQIRSFYPQPYMVRHVTKMFDLVYHGRIGTWDIQWFYCCLFNNGLCVVPRVNLISNIGFVGTHTTGGMDDAFLLPTFAVEVENLRHPDRVLPDLLYDQGLFEKRIKTPIWKRMKVRIMALSRRLLTMIRETGAPR